MIATTETLKSRVLKGSFWTIGGYGTQQVIRLASNLILTRLLFPEAFGLMALVTAFFTGLSMFSDMGLHVNVVQSKHGDDEDYLNVVWTLGLVRGVLITIAACLLAQPMASFYGEPQLFWLICATSLTSFISSFRSAHIGWLQRHLMLGRQVMWNISWQLVTMLATIVSTLLLQSVWGLVLGALIGTTYMAISSHFVVPHARSRLAWNQKQVTEIVNFGKWIFVSTVVTFIALYGDQLILGKIMTLDQLAIYSIALIFSQVPFQVFDHLAQQILLPAYAILHREGRDGSSRDKIFQMRAGMILAFFPFIALLQLGAKPLIEMLYDPRYHAAGDFVSILVIGSAAACMNATLRPMLLAAGESRLHFLAVFSRLIFMLSAVGFGYHFGGIQGFVLGVACMNYVQYPVLCLLIRRHGIWTPKFDLAAMGGFLLFLGVANGWLV